LAWGVATGWRLLRFGLYPGHLPGFAWCIGGQGALPGWRRRVRQPPPRGTRVGPGRHRTVAGSVNARRVDMGRRTKAADGPPEPEPGLAGSEPVLSVVIPCLNESIALPQLLRDLKPLRDLGHEVIVVDGGSTDASPELAAAGADSVLKSEAGRALQMNAGAAHARGSVFWFLHADSRVDRDVHIAVLAALARGRHWGRCAVRLSGDGLLLALTARLMNLRSCLTGIATGDQGVFVTRSAFAAVGGFPAIPLMEDIEMARRLKRQAGRPACVSSPLVTSSRRWEQRGVVRTILLMWRLRLAFWRGADPAWLAERYR